MRDPDLNFRQTYTLEKVVDHKTTTILRNARVAPSLRR